MEFQTSGSRRQFLSAVAMTAGGAIMLRSRLGWATDVTDPRVADIVARLSGSTPIITSTFLSTQPKCPARISI
jgi:hypothetical protein